jgi:hypothetical protein
MRDIVDFSSDHKNSATAGGCSDLDALAVTVRAGLAANEIEARIDGLRAAQAKPIAGVTHH